MTLRRALLAVLALCACSARDPGRAVGRGARAAEVRYRQGQAPGDAGAWLLEEVPGARWDPALQAAARELAAAAGDASARLTPAAIHLALARSGFPGPARFSRLYTGGALPAALLAEVRSLRGEAPGLDVALASRSFGDGTVLWVLGAAPHWIELDPIPRDLALDEPLPLQVEAPGASALTLFVAPPDGPVAPLALTPGLTRWVDLFHVPGEYGLEVVDLGRDRARVLLAFSVFVEQPPGALARLPSGAPAPDPVAATAWLYRALAERRAEAGLPPVEPFPAFEPLAREHAAFMAATGRVEHTLPGVTEGVAARAWQLYHPRARHFEDLAAAYSAAEALDLVWASPGHRRNLLCEECTHAAIGVALEPALQSLPRLFVTWELLAFPQGPPRAIERPR